MEKGNGSLEKFVDCLEKRNILSAEHIFEEYSKVWDTSETLTKLSKYLSSQYEVDDDFFKGCSNLTYQVALRKDASEVIRWFAENIRSINNDTKFISLLNPILKAVERINLRQDTKPLVCFLNATLKYVKTVEVRDVNCDLDEVSLRVHMLCWELMRVYRFIVTEICNDFSDLHFKIIIVEYLAGLLGTPLVHLDLGSLEEKSKIRKMAENIVDHILFLCLDPFFLLEYQKSEVILSSTLGYGIYLYLLFCENIESEKVPKVFNYSYIFYTSLPNIVELLNSEESLVLKKGLSLIETILSRCVKLSFYIVELKITEEFFRVVEHIISYNDDENFRIQAFKIFQMCLSRLEAKGQYLLLYNLVPRISHSGLSGFAIIQFKEILVDLEKKKDFELKYFENHNLYKFITMCCDIPYDKSNLMNSADIIISILNLIRFTVLQKKWNNIDHFKKIVSNWRKKCLDPLEVLVNDAKANLIDKKKEVEQQKEMHEEDFSVSVCGETITNLPENINENIELSITGVEMIKSLLDRLIEILKVENLC